MNPQASKRQPRVFTVEEANATLPLVRAIANDLATRSQEVVELRQRLELLSEGRDAKSGDPYSDELDQMQKELARQDEQLREYLSELTDLGVISRVGPDNTMNVVDFPAVLDGRKVYLCWQLGEPEVAHWHDRDAGFDGRRSLATTAAGTDS